MMARYAYGPSQMVTKCTLPHWVVAWHQLLGTAQGTQLLLHAEINLCIWFWWSYNNYWFVGLVSSLWCCTQLQQHCILQYILWSDIKPSEKHFCCANVGPTTIVSAFPEPVWCASFYQYNQRPPNTRDNPGQSSFCRLQIPTTLNCAFIASLIRMCFLHPTIGSKTFASGLPCPETTMAHPLRLFQMTVPSGIVAPFRITTMPFWMT